MLSSIGAILTAYIDGNILVMIFGFFVFVYGIYLLVTTISSKKEPQKHNRIFWELGFAAGFLEGLIATGLGKMIVPCIWNHEKINNSSDVIGSAVVIIFIVDIVAALTRMNPVFIGALIENWSQLFDIMIFVVPSVVIDGQLGPRAIKNVNNKWLRIYISLMLIFVSFLIMYYV